MDSNRYSLLQSVGFLVSIIILCLLFIHQLNLVNIAMLLVIPILFSAIYNTSREVFIISIIAVTGFNVLFIPPRFSLTVHDSRYIISFITMIAIGQILSFFAKKAQEAKEIQMSQKIQDALLESLSHELRTPLSVINGCSLVLTEDDLDLNENDRKTLLETIRDNAEEMKKRD